MIIKWNTSNFNSMNVPISLSFSTQQQQASRYASMEFPKVFSRLLQQELNENAAKSKSGEKEEEQIIITNAIKTTYSTIDNTLPQSTKYSGCTASVMIQFGPIMYIANVGDSQSFIASYNPSTQQIQILYQTRQDKPHLPDERRRIEDMGGRVILPPPLRPGQTKQLGSSRVIIPISLVESFSLAMSRSIGDHEGRAVGVISEPIIDRIDLMNLTTSGSGSSSNKLELFAFVASDGLYDHVSPMDVAKKLALSMYNNNKINSEKNEYDDGMMLMKACEELIMTSSYQWIASGMAYRDDISIAVTKLQI